jgi:WD40 repeat protein
MTNRILFTFCLTTISFSGIAQPGTEIYLFDLKIKRDQVIISNPKNITNHKGYDNQPFFHPDKPLLYFVSANDEGRTDIIEFNYSSGESKKITQTHDREYSPTVTPDKQFISCILQRDSGAQDLVKYPIGGGTPEIIISDLIVGYHTWANAGQVMVFTLPQPFKLQLIDVSSKSYSVVAEQIGRSLHKIPGQKALSFLQKIKEDEWTVNALDPDTKLITTITQGLPGAEHSMAWTPDGKIIMSDDKKLFFYDPNKSKTWSPIEVKADGQFSFSRIAVSPDGKLMALVITEP